MNERPLTKSPLRSSLLYIVAANPDASGRDLRDDLEDALDQNVYESTVSEALSDFADAGLVEKRETDGAANEHRLTDEGRSLLTDDLEWQLAALEK